jgi:hypothetical protein
MDGGNAENAGAFFGLVLRARRSGNISKPKPIRARVLATSASTDHRAMAV